MPWVYIYIYILNLWFLLINEFYADITPSSTDTPIQKSIAGETPQLDKPFNEDDTINSLHKPSPNKLLFELFRESFNSDCHDENPNSYQWPETTPSICYLPPKSANKSSRLSVVNIVSNPRKRKAAQPAKCCLPNLVRGFSVKERQKALSPA